MKAVWVLWVKLDAEPGGAWRCVKARPAPHHAADAAEEAPRDADRPLQRGGGPDGQPVSPPPAPPQPSSLLGGFATSLVTTAIR